VGNHVVGAPKAKNKNRVKKGPKRVKKTQAQLDQEMDEWKAQQ
jgi:hypothetical protein